MAGPGELKHAIHRIEQHLQSMRRVGAGLDQPSQAEVHVVLKTLSRIYWSRGVATSERTAVRYDYISLLETIKLVADDAFIEAITAAERKPASERQRATTECHDRYLTTVQEWVRASPIIDRTLAQDLDFDRPQRQNAAITTAARTRTSLGFAPTPPIGALTKRLTAALDRQISLARQRARAKTFDLVLTREWMHHAGIVFVLLQAGATLSPAQLALITRATAHDRRLLQLWLIGARALGASTGPP